MAWDDGSTTYEVVHYGKYWTITENEGFIHPNYVHVGTRGPLASSTFISTSTAGPPYRLQPSAEEGFLAIQEGGGSEPRRSQVTAIYSRRAEAAEFPKADDDTTAYLGLELSRIMLKTNDGSFVPIEFVEVNDTIPGSNENTLWTQLSTVGVSIISSIDSLFVEGTVSARALPRIRANAADGHRLSFELVDARTGQVIGRIGGERLFTADGKYTLRERARVLNLTGREVLIRPSLRGMVKGRPDMAYTIVHVHTLVGDSSSEGLNLAAKSQTGAPKELPTEFALHQNYPNPFNPSTQIRFDLPEPGNVSLVVYDVLGRKVAELASGYWEPGYHTAVWDAADFGSGVYFARLTIADASRQLRFSRTSKLLLMK